MNIDTGNSRTTGAAVRPGDDMVQLSQRVIDARFSVFERLASVREQLPDDVHAETAAILKESMA